MRSQLRITTRRALGAAAVAAAFVTVLVPHTHDVIGKVWSDRNVKRDIVRLGWDG